MLHITLGPVRTVDSSVDQLGRTIVGYDPQMSEDELHEANRGCWVLGARADSEGFALFSFQGTVVQAMEIDEIVDVGGRRALEGPVLRPGHPVYDAFVGSASPVTGRNPVLYFDHPVGRNKCGCGCGEEVVRGYFLSGHDQRAIHERIAKIGSVRDFIRWFDSAYHPAPSGRSTTTG